MNCPLCGKDHIISSDLLPSRPSVIFSPCSQCMIKIRPKDQPVSDYNPVEKCICGRRFIDDVMADIWILLKNMDIFKGNEPLSDIGTPLINPGVFLLRPPVLPSRSLIFITNKITVTTALRIYEEVPEVMGIISRCGDVPGAGDLVEGKPSKESSDTLLCGCDMRADVFQTRRGPLLITKLQHAIHIEYPKGTDLKVRAVESNIHRFNPDVFIDACSGPGTLGLVASLMGVREVIMCDIWYASAWCAGYNLLVNQKRLGLSQVRMFQQMEGMPRIRSDDPELVCEANGGKCQSKGIPWILYWHSTLFTSRTATYGF